MIRNRKPLTHWGRDPECVIIRIPEVEPIPDAVPRRNRALRVPPDAVPRIRNWQPPSKLSAVADALVELLQFLTACGIVALVIFLVMK